MAGYRILGLVGAGAMGQVYLCDNQSEPEKPVALKVLPKDADPEAKGRFKREILANSFFSHEGALEVYDAGKDDHGNHYLAMEFFDGRDLEKVLDETQRLPAKEAALLARQVFETLGASHAAGLVHRDVKPANILLSWDGKTAKLMDYGIAVIEDLNEFKDMVFTSMEGNVTGTPEYMSPEQAGGDVVKSSSDLYSMGVVLYQMLSGALPFESETSGGYMTCHMIEDPIPLGQADPSCKALPAGLLQLVDSLLTKTPPERPASAAEVIAVLGSLLPTLGSRPTGRLFSFLGWRRG
jgi:serine/threonine-protein kinase